MTSLSTTRRPPGIRQYGLGCTHARHVAGQQQTRSQGTDSSSAASPRSSVGWWACSRAHRAARARPLGSRSASRLARRNARRVQNLIITSEPISIVREAIIVRQPKGCRQERRQPPAAGPLCRCAGSRPRTRFPSSPSCAERANGIGLNIALEIAPVVEMLVCKQPSDQMTRL